MARPPTLLGRKGHQCCGGTPPQCSFLGPPEWHRVTAGTTGLPWDEITGGSPGSSDGAGERVPGPSVLRSPVIPSAEHRPQGRKKPGQGRQSPCGEWDKRGRGGARHETGGAEQTAGSGVPEAPGPKALPAAATCCASAQDRQGWRHPTAFQRDCRRTRRPNARERSPLARGRARPGAGWGGRML